METRFVPDAPAAWLVYELGSIILALPGELRAAADAIAALPSPGLSASLVALERSGIADEAAFAVLEISTEGLRVALKGPATVATGTHVVTGLGVKSYVDRTVPYVPVVRLTVPGGEWTLTLAPPPRPRTAAVENTEVTAIPELELSLPLLPSPPRLGLDESDDRTVVVAAPANVGPVLPTLPPYPSVAGPRRPAFDDRDADEEGIENEQTVVVADIAMRRRKRMTKEPGSPVLSLELPGGARQLLDAVVLVGRAPSAPVGGPASRLVRLVGDGDVSRNHARVEVEGGTVLVTDLGSRNGTIVHIPGRPALKLREGEPTPVLVDTVIDFGGGIQVSVREG